MTTLTDRQTAIAQPPAKKWWSHWRTRRHVEIHSPSGVQRFGPNRHFGLGPYPSKDAAHTAAMEAIADNAWNSEGMTYLGCAPEGERP